MPYSKFIKNLYECIKEHSNCAAFSLTVFAEGPGALMQGYSGTQEYAILRNEYARFFVDVMDQNPELFMPDSNPCVLEASRIKLGEVKVSHSCYPKNLRRWMKGTISRKQKCRAQFCALVWCWYDLWMEEVNPRVDKVSLEQTLLGICREYTACGDRFRMEALWTASICAYTKALEQR